MKERNTKMNKLNKIVWKLTKYVTLPILGLLVLVAIFAPDVEKEEAPQAILTASYKDWYIVNPANGVFTFEITNTGDTEAKNIECFVRINDGSSAYRGFGTWEAPFSIPAGETRELRGTMTITNEGSLWVNQGTAECEAK